MESTRQLKVARLLQKELSQILLREGTAIYGNTMVSVTVVRVSPDLSFARIYLSVFGTKEIEAVFKNLDKHKAHLRYLLGKQIGKQVRIIPEIAFFHDDSIDYYENIDGILKTLDVKPEKPDSDVETTQG